MSAADFYLNQGYTPTWKTVTVSSTSTATVWTPRTSTKIVLTQLHLATNLACSSAFYYGNLAGQKILQYNHAASSAVSLDLLADSNTYDRELFVSLSNSTGDGFKITAMGFEIPT